MALLPAMLLISRCVLQQRYICTRHMCYAVCGSVVSLSFIFYIFTHPPDDFGEQQN